jgi:hypothetical protein
METKIRNRFITVLYRMIVYYELNVNENLDLMFVELGVEFRIQNLCLEGKFCSKRSNVLRNSTTV